MTMENQPFEDVSPIKNGDFPAIAMLVSWGGNWWGLNMVSTLQTGVDFHIEYVETNNVFFVGCLKIIQPTYHPSIFKIPGI